MRRMLLSPDAGFLVLRQKHHAAAARQSGFLGCWSVLLAALFNRQCSASNIYSTVTSGDLRFAILFVALYNGSSDSGCLPAAPLAGEYLR